MSVAWERRGDRYYAYCGAAGGYGDTLHEALAELARRLAAAERLFVVIR